MQPLRQDLTIERAPQALGETGGWLLHDALRSGFFRIPEAAVRLLGFWGKGSADEAAAAYAAHYGEPPDAAAFGQLAEFLARNELTSEADWRKLAAKSAATRRSPAATLLHSYLFFRLPLIAPDRLLAAAWPFVSFLFTRGFAAASALAALLGLWLVSRQWEAFLGAGASLMSLGGAMTYGVSLIIIKAVHESGHAFMAHRHGVRVPTIGLAFMMMMPVLYTDTSAAWRLPPRKRLMIDAGGLFAELAIAAWATLAWVFLPDGALRSAAFAAASISWVMSLAVNLNPLMRFDGYYLLADSLGAENLQERAFALARWRLREALFGFGDPVPDPLPLRRSAIAFAFAVWAYRLVLFLGIAVLVYHFAVKIIGIGLFAAEIILLLVLPVWREARQWLARRAEMRLNRQALRSLILLALLLLALFLPLSRSIDAPALFRPGKVHGLHAPGPGTVISVAAAEGGMVRKGDILLLMHAPDLASEAAIAALRRKRGAVDEARIAADAEGRANRAIALSRAAALDAGSDAVTALEARYAIRAPVDGLVANIYPGLHEGRWLSASPRLMALFETGAPQITGYVAESARLRIEPGAAGKFLPDDPRAAAFPVRLTEIASASAASIAMPALASSMGGPIPVDPESRDALKPAATWYETAFSAGSDAVLPARDMAGLIRIDAEPQSFAGQALRRILGILIRESGF